MWLWRDIGKAMSDPPLVKLPPVRPPAIQLLTDEELVNLAAGDLDAQARLLYLESRAV